MFVIQVIIRMILSQLVQIIVHATSPGWNLVSCFVSTQVSTKIVSMTCCNDLILFSLEDIHCLRVPLDE